MKILEKLWFQPYTPIIFIVTLVLLIYFILYPTFQKVLRSPPTTPTSLTPQISPTPPNLLSQLGKLIVLPTGETPQIITITDIDRFKDQPFFKNAKNGDVLILYTKNKQAILFDPKDNKILNTAPIADATESATPTPTP